MQSRFQPRDSHTANTDKYPDAFLLPTMTGLLAFHYAFWKFTMSSADSHASAAREFLQAAAWPVCAFKQFAARRK